MTKWEDKNIGKTFIDKTTGTEATFISRSDIPSVGSLIDERWEICAEQKENSKEQIDKLANFIMDEIEGEPGKSEGAVGTAIRLLKKLPEHKEEKETLSDKIITQYGFENDLIKVSNVKQSLKEFIDKLPKIFVMELRDTKGETDSKGEITREAKEHFGEKLV